MVRPHSGMVPESPAGAPGPPPIHTTCAATGPTTRRYGARLHASAISVIGSDLFFFSLLSASALVAGPATRTSDSRMDAVGRQRLLDAVDGTGNTCLWYQVRARLRRRRPLRG